MKSMPKRKRFLAMVLVCIMALQQTGISTLAEETTVTETAETQSQIQAEAEEKAQAEAEARNIGHALSQEIQQQAKELHNPDER